MPTGAVCNEIAGTTLVDDLDALVGVTYHRLVPPVHDTPRGRTGGTSCGVGTVSRLARASRAEEWPNHDGLLAAGADAYC